MPPVSFRLSSAIFSLAGQGQAPVTFVDQQTTKPTKPPYVTLLMGANGTSKSRVLSSLAEHFRGLYTLTTGTAQTSQSRALSRHDSLHGISCNSVNVIGGNTIILPDGSKASVPTKIIAIANLVRDKFVYSPSPFSERDQSYYYLGVRQASNLTTTGALDRISAESIISMALSSDRLDHFISWSRSFLPDTEFFIGFTGFRSSRVKNFINVDEALSLASRTIDASSRLKRIVPQINYHDLAKSISIVAEIIFHSEAIYLKDSVSQARSEAMPIIPISSSKLQDIAKLKHIDAAFYALKHGMALLSPTVILRSDEYLEFSQLSSGQQNIISTGARLISYASTGSLILIDEPEVSLNVAWQQRYIELILDALKRAHGSHVIIASHSPYLVSDLPDNLSSVVLARKNGKITDFETKEGKFFGWGSEAILYDVLDIPSASNFLFQRELTKVLKHIQERGKDKELIGDFLNKASRLHFDDIEPLAKIVSDIQSYYEGI